MIKFVREFDRVMIFNDVGSEDGWVFEFDHERKKFLVWDNIERHPLLRNCIECDTLGEVLSAINSYT